MQLNNQIEGLIPPTGDILPLIVLGIVALVVVGVVLVIVARKHKK